MGVPQVPEQVRRAPIVAVRAVFAGIGRIVMSAGRADAGHADALAPSQAGTAQRRLRPAGADVPAAAAGPPAEHAASRPDLPLASYDTLSLASIRARLRGLDVGQLKVLLDYEATNAERPEVIGMFERRIEKLESSG